MGNDITILYGIILFFVLIGAVTPFINAEYGTSFSEYSAEALEEGINPDQAGSSISAFNVIGSIMSMFFWTFGNIPVFVDLVIFIPLRIILAVIVARNIWIGGGA